MEKLQYMLWKNDGEDAEAFKQTLLGALSDKLLAAKPLRLQFNVVDADVQDAAGSRMVNSQPAIDGLLSLWLDTAVFRKPFEEILSQYVSRLAGYLVTESEPIPNTTQVANAGERTPGYSQVVFLQVPPRLSYNAWLEYWLGTHTHVGVETQANFRYTQNVVVRPLTYAAPVYHAIVEECFPQSAMQDPAVFYDAVGDEEKFKTNLKRMMDSCAHFIDMDKIDCIPTSEYVMKK